MRAAAVQMNATDHVARNMQTADRLVRDARGMSVYFDLRFPELYRIPAPARRRPEVYDWTQR